MNMKIYYVANARMPNAKAHGIQIAKTCESFIEAGVDLTLIVPNRETDERSVQDFYKLRVPVPTRKLTVLDWYLAGRIGYFISSLFFMLSSVLFLWGRRLNREKFTVYTVDIDTFSSSFLPLIGMPCISEIHDIKPINGFTRFFMKRCSGFITINSLIAQYLSETFSVAATRMLVEGNGTEDPSHMETPSREEARVGHALPADVTISLYAGRIYGWKELGILSEAAALLPENHHIYFVGGTEQEYVAVTGEVPPPSLRFAGSVEPHAMFSWYAAADSLLILGSTQNVSSYKYTSPMKAYEYMAAGKPIVASDTLALRCIFSDEDVLFYVPDDATSLATAIVAAAGDTVRAARSRALADAHTWKARAARIMSFIQQFTDSYHA